MNTQPELFQSDQKASSQSDTPVVCLGIEFENDTVRREYFTGLLREKLKDPEFRSIEGFPLGEDEDILNLSDPPYYTACPNPWIADFINEWESEKPEKPEGYEYHREPFAADVSEGKSHPIYTAHTYHTKVPHRAVMQYILYYTEPGDIVFDGFCGTGMVGVAAKMCGNRSEVEALGYQVNSDGAILDKEINKNGEEVWREFSKLGVRKVVLNDLSPAATYIAHNYNKPANVSEFESLALKTLKEIEERYGWMYETLHSDLKTKGTINYTIWSDVFICAECSGEVVFWDAAVDKEEAKVSNDFNCSHCNAVLSKRSSERAFVSYYDKSLQKVVKIAKQVPVLINYSVAGITKRQEKIPDEHDIKLIQKISEKEKSWHPTIRMMLGQETRRNDPLGMTHLHHFYTTRNLAALAETYSLINSSDIKFVFTGFLSGATKLNQFHLKNYVFGGGGVNPGVRKGTLYAPSISLEVSVISLFRDRLRTQLRALSLLNFKEKGIVSTSSTNNSVFRDDLSNTLDYIFIDPPFGANLNYSELSYFWESWLGVLTENKNEAIESRVQKKGALEYRQLMTSCFKSAYNMLKPGHWMTVEFSNTKASVWNSIQESINDAGFIIANVSVLDKKQGGINANVTKTAVKQDLAITAYKPSTSLEGVFKKEDDPKRSVWSFLETHLSYLPIIKFLGSTSQIIPERDPRILYDQVVSYYVRKGYSVPIDSQDFQLGLAQRFSERDGMYFLEEQAAEYDRKKMLSGGRAVQQSLFISDEASAIEWLRNLLRDKPQGYQDINPKFMTEISGWDKNEVNLELSTLLEQNFLRFDGKGRLPEQIHSYLSTNWKDMRNLEKDDPQLIAKAKDRWYVPDPAKAGDLEKLREKALLREFDDYIENKKKLKLFRLEAVRAGFKKSWQERDYKTIIDVAEKLPTKVLEEDPKLLMWYDQAITRSEVL